MDKQYQHYDNKKRGGKKYLRKGGINAVMGKEEEKGKKNREEEAEKEGVGVGGKTERLVGFSRILRLKILFSFSSGPPGCYVTENGLLDS